jgi:hypothetical protein
MRAVRRSLVLVALVLAGCAGAVGQDGSGPIVLVSGRDDHGLLQLSQVPLYAEPEGGAIIGDLPDGSFAEVLEVRGTWLEIQSLADPTTTGWIDDFFLRDRALLHNSQQVRLLASRGRDPVEIQVETLDGSAPPFWVATDHLAEVGADIAPHDH